VTTNPAGHGGEHRAVLVYQIESYRYWQEQLGRDAYGYGQQGRTSPSRACRAGIRMNDARIPALLVSRHRPGFYLPVLREGVVRAGDEIVLQAAGP
jgi:MOSC domain-containing protein YiiM